MQKEEKNKSTNDLDVGADTDLLNAGEQFPTEVAELEVNSKEDVNDEKATDVDIVAINELINMLIDGMFKTDKLPTEECISNIEKLADAYKKGYRHSYSLMSEQMYKSIKADGANLENVHNNVELVMGYVASMLYDKKQRDGFDKLRDHINLEVLRIENSNSIIDNARKDITEMGDKTQEKIEKSYRDIQLKLEDKIKQRIKEIRGLQNESKNINKRMENMYSEYISILGIFSAVVLVFFGGASIFSGIFSSVAEASIWEIGFASALVGMIVFNIVFMFLYILSKIINRPIQSENVDELEICAISKLRRKYPYVFWFNFLMIIILFICA